MPTGLYSLNKADSRYQKNLIREDMVSRLSQIDGSPRFMTFPGETWEVEWAVVQRRKALGKEPANWDCLECHAKTWERAIWNRPSVLADEAFTKCKFEEVKLHGKYSASWIDFTGQLTIKRIAKLKELWNRTTHFMAITSLQSRWQDECRVIGHIGTLKCLELFLPQFKVLHHIERYGGKGSPMNHIVLGK